MTIEYMLQAYEEGLVQTGEYVFIAFLLEPDVLYTVHMVRLCPYIRLHMRLSYRIVISTEL